MTEHSEHFEQLLYESGLTAQGSWDQMDQYDREAIQHLYAMAIQDCINNVTAWERDSRNHISHLLRQHYQIDQ
jgi:hypothetical protein